MDRKRAAVNIAGIDQNAVEMVKELMSSAGYHSLPA